MPETKAVLGLAPAYFIRPKSSDWRHMKLLETIFSRPINGWSFRLRHSLFHIVTYNSFLLSFFVSRAAASKFFKRSLPHPFFIRVRGPEYAGKYDILYAYGYYPTGSNLPPVIWHTSPTNSDMLQRRGIPLKTIEAEIRVKAKCLETADIVAVSSDFDKSEIIRTYPGYEHKIEVLPFMLPYLSATDRNAVLEKHAESQIKLLFVGRQARRKGLDLLLAAFTALRRTQPELSLTIVTDFSDGAVEIPDCGGVRLLGPQPIEQVLALMREAHIFAMPSREEAYGIVYIEAMASGAVSLAPDYPQQRTILQDGAIGSLVELTSQSIEDELARLVTGQEYRLKKALNGLNAFETKYSPTVVLARYVDVFTRASSQYHEKRSP